MIVEPLSHNPYEAPLAPLSEERTPPKTFRWQVIPAALCGFMVLAGLTQARRIMPMLGGLELYVSFGAVGLWCAASALWLKSRWWLAAIVTVIAYVTTPVVHG